MISLLKYFCGYWYGMKVILSNIFNNEIIPDENFPDYGSTRYMQKFEIEKGSRDHNKK